MNIHPKLYARHCNCDVYIDIHPRDRRGQLITKHAGALRCRNHNAWIKWISRTELDQLKHLAREPQ